jgi:hypothetical protein
MPRSLTGDAGPASLPLVDGRNFLNGSPAFEAYYTNALISFALVHGDRMFCFAHF